MAGGLWESQLTAFVPDVGNGGDKLAAAARWQAQPDETTAIAIIESVRVVRAPAAAPSATSPATPAPTAGPAASAPPAPPAPGADPTGWRRHLVGFKLSLAAPAEMAVTTHDPTEGANLSLDSKTFEVHVYLSEPKACDRSRRTATTRSPLNRSSSTGRRVSSTTGSAPRADVRGAPSSSSSNHAWHPTFT